MYISPAEVPTEDLRALVERSYSTFRSKEVVPLVKLEDNLHLLELFHGPSYSFKDCMLWLWHWRISDAILARGRIWS